MSGKHLILFTALLVCICAVTAAAQFGNNYFEEVRSIRGELLWDAKTGATYAFYDELEGETYQVNVVVFDGKNYEKIPIVGGVGQQYAYGLWAVAQQENTGIMLLVYYKENALIGQQISKNGQPKGKPRKIRSMPEGRFFALGSFGKNQFLIAYNREENSESGDKEGVFLQKLNKKGKPKGDEVFLNNFNRDRVEQYASAVKYGPKGPFLYLVEGHVEEGVRDTVVRVLQLNDSLGNPEELFKASQDVNYIYNLIPFYFVRYNPATGRHIISWQFDFDEEQAYLAAFDNDGNKVKPTQMLQKGVHLEQAVYNEKSGLITTVLLWPDQIRPSRMGFMNFSPRGQIVSTGMNILGILAPADELSYYIYARIAPLPKGGMLLMYCSYFGPGGIYELKIIPLGVPFDGVD